MNNDYHNKKVHDEPMLFADEEMGLIPLEAVTGAYRRCLRRKRGTIDALRFECNAESECVRLWQDLNTGHYRPSRSIVFISNRPVKREIFGAAFRDRVVDTIFAEHMTPLLEEQYIDDNYSTRVGKGTLYGILRVEQMIRQCSDFYRRDCYVMKLDMQSYFMSLPKERVYEKFAHFISTHYHEPDQALLLSLLRIIINDRPELHCVRNSARHQWDGLPRNKSLFHSDGRHGLPIGKIVSQMSALVFMDDLDHEIKALDKNIYYGHYMDDIIMVDQNPEFLAWVRDEVVDRWAKENGVRRHPRKMYLQHYAKGVLFTGGMVKQGRIYISRRTLGNWRTSIERYNRLAKSSPDYVEKHCEQFVATMNSYLGLTRHFAALNIVHRYCRMIGKEWYRVMYIKGKGRCYKCVLRKQYKPKTVAINRLHEELASYFRTTKKFKTTKKTA